MINIQPWSSKRELKKLLGDEPLWNSLEACLLRHLSDKEPEDAINHLIELCAADTVKNIQNREQLEGLLNAKYEKPKRKKRKAKR